MKSIKLVKVLVIDDEVRIRSACKEILTDFGVSVSTVKDGEKGIKIIKKNIFDIILLDLMMPKMSGFNVLSIIKKLPIDSLVIVITGYATLEHSVDAMQNGAFDFISKPFTPDTLKEVITKAINHIYNLRDITDNRSRLKSLINRLAEGVMCLNNDGSIVLVNNSFLRLLNINKKDIYLNKHYSSLIFQKEIKKIILEVTNSSTKFCEIEKEIKIINKILSIKCTSFYDYSKRRVGIILVAHDITSFKELDHIKSEFVSIVSHEIRSPMASVAMQIDLILNGLVGKVSDQQKVILQRISDKIDVLVNMTTELLDLSKIDAGYTNNKNELVNVNEILKKQFDFYKPLAESKKIEILLKISKHSEKTLIQGNNLEVEEIFSNIITNGLKYNKIGGKLFIDISVVEDQILITFSDSGIGIPCKDKLKIFDRFYRVKNEQTKNIDGTGLGLSIVKKLIDIYKGKIEVKSILNKGSVFLIYLPIYNSK